MATKLLVCPECASEVAPGRFACTSCGALLASVASAPRSLGWMDAMTPPAVSPASPASVDAVVDTIEPETRESNGRGDTIGPAWAHGPLERVPGETDRDMMADDAASAIETPAGDGVDPIDVAEQRPDGEPVAVADVATGTELEPTAAAEPVVETAAAEPIVKTAAALEAEPDARAEPGPNIQFDGDVEVARDDAPLALAAATDLAADETASIVESPAAAIAGDTAITKPSEPTNEPSWPETRGWPPPGAAQPAPEPAPRPRAGAYLPPSAVLTTVGDPPEAAIAKVPGRPASASAANPSVAGTVDDGVPAAPRSRRLPDIDRALPPQAVVVGAAIATLGFLLPWAPIVIGSTHTGGYVDQWGLAAPGQAALLLVIVALGAAASQVDRLPAWARPGLPAVILAGILVGLVWPYVFAGGFQPSIGVYLTLTAAIVLVVGGLLDLRVSRHARSSRPV